MANTRLFAVGVAICVAFAAATTVAAIDFSTGADALQADELLRVASMPAESGDPIDDQLKYVFEAFSGSRRWDQVEVTERFTAGFVQNFDAQRLNELTANSIEDIGATRFVRITERTPGSLRALGVADDGTPMKVWIQTAPDGRIESLSLEEGNAPPRRPVYETALFLLAGWLAVGAAIVTSRRPPYIERWVLLAGSVLAASGVLILSDAVYLYTLGRVAPAALPLLGVGLLAPTSRLRALIPFAVVAVLPSALAPAFRDSRLVGHPAIWGRLGDSASVYRTLLVLGSGVTAAVLAGLAAACWHESRSQRRRVHEEFVVSAGIAGLWSLALAGSAVNVGLGANEVWGDLLSVLVLCAAAAVPASVILRSVIASWDQSGLTDLVVELDSHGMDLQAAAAKALEDSTLQLLTSDDGLQLIDSQGETVDLDEIPTGQTVTEIRSSNDLVGALMHDSALGRNSDRLRAVAATAGMALSVRRLNNQVTSQLDEVRRSRTRIVAAGDIARRKIERDLHDGAQQRLVALGVQLQLARRVAQSGGQVDLVEILEDATHEVRSSLEDLRAVSRGSRPPLLAERGLGPAIEALAERMPIPLQVKVTVKGASPAAERTAYFIVAEALTNITKHANASKASVLLTASAGELHISVADDGCGGACPSPGSGLEGIVDRAEAVGGRLHVSSYDTGTTVEAVIPCG